MLEWIFVLLRIPDTIILAARPYRCKFDLLIAIHKE